MEKAIPPGQIQELLLPGRNRAKDRHFDPGATIVLNPQAVNARGPGSKIGEISPAKEMPFGHFLTAAAIAADDPVLNPRSDAVINSTAPLSATTP